MENINYDIGLYQQYSSKGIKPIYYFLQIEYGLYRFDINKEKMKFIGTRHTRKDRQNCLTDLSMKLQNMHLDECLESFQYEVHQIAWQIFETILSEDTEHYKKDEWYNLDYQDIYHIPYAGYSDYSGCAAERTNFDHFMKEYDFVEDIGSGIYGSTEAGINFTEFKDCQGEQLPDVDTLNEFLDTVNGLSDYPVIDDEAMSFKEQELIEESWNSYGRSDFISELQGRIEYLIGEGKLNTGNLLDEYGEADLDNFDIEIDEVSEQIFQRLPHGPEIETGGSAYFDFDLMLEQIDVEDLWIFTNEQCKIDVHQMKLFNSPWINAAECID